MRALIVAVAVLFAGLGAWMAMSLGESSATLPPESADLGPVDGFDLPPTDVERVALGTTAPDFRLDSYAGSPVVLSDYRGEQNVVLVFYRGHW